MTGRWVLELKISAAAKFQERVVTSGFSRSTHDMMEYITYFRVKYLDSLIDFCDGIFRQPWSSHNTSWSETFDELNLPMSFSPTVKEIIRRTYNWTCTICLNPLPAEGSHCAHVFDASKAGEKQVGDIVLLEYTDSPWTLEVADAVSLGLLDPTEPPESYNRKESWNGVIRYFTSGRLVLSPPMPVLEWIKEKLEDASDSADVWKIFNELRFNRPTKLLSFKDHYALIPLFHAKDKGSYELYCNAPLTSSVITQSGTFETISHPAKTGQNTYRIFSYEEACMHSNPEIVRFASAPPQVGPIDYWHIPIYCHIILYIFLQRTINHSKSKYPEIALGHQIYAQLLKLRGTPTPNAFPMIAAEVETEFVSLERSSLAGNSLPAEIRSDSYPGHKSRFPGSAKVTAKREHDGVSASFPSLLTGEKQSPAGGGPCTPRRPRISDRLPPTHPTDPPRLPPSSPAGDSAGTPRRRPPTHPCCGREKSGSTEHMCTVCYTMVAKSSSFKISVAVQVPEDGAQGGPESRRNICRTLAEWVGGQNVKSYSFGATLTAGAILGIARRQRKGWDTYKVISIDLRCLRCGFATRGVANMQMQESVGSERMALQHLEAARRKECIRRALVGDWNWGKHTESAQEDYTCQHTTRPKYIHPAPPPLLRRQTISVVCGLGIHKEKKEDPVRNVRKIEGEVRAFRLMETLQYGFPTEAGVVVVARLELGVVQWVTAEGQLTVMRCNRRRWEFVRRGTGWNYND
ncbi:hypothetical protein K438DRAFT_1771065 [Mycena galopus ATCC 62051]|nr:hypothetical protein K438DRAFT_1771065 [Mycena galopus ATCC 62051]